MQPEVIVLIFLSSEFSNFAKMTINRLIMLDSRKSINEVLQVLELKNLSPNKFQIDEQDYYFVYENARQATQAHEILITQNYADFRKIYNTPSDYDYYIILKVEEFNSVFENNCFCKVVDRILFHDEVSIKMCYFRKDSALADYRKLLFSQLCPKTNFSGEFKNKIASYYFKIPQEQVVITKRVQFIKVSKIDQFAVLMYENRQSASDDYKLFYQGDDLSQDMLEFAIKQMTEQDAINFEIDDQADRNFYIKVTNDFDPIRCKCYKVVQKLNFKLLVYERCIVASEDLMKINAQYLINDYVIDANGKSVESLAKYKYYVIVDFNSNLKNTQYLSIGRQMNQMKLSYNQEEQVLKDIRTLMIQNDIDLIPMFKDNKPFHYQQPGFFYIETDERNTITSPLYFRVRNFEGNKLCYFYDTKQDALTDYNKFIAKDPTAVLKDPLFKVLKKYSEPIEDVLQKFRLYNYFFEVDNKMIELELYHYEDLSMEINYLKFYYNNLKVASRDAQKAAVFLQHDVVVRQVANAEIERTFHSNVDKSKYYCKIQQKVNQQLIQFMNDNPYFQKYNEQYKILICKNIKQASFLKYQASLFNVKISEPLLFDIAEFDDKLAGSLMRLTSSRLSTSSKADPKQLTFEILLKSAKVPGNLNFKEQSIRGKTVLLTYESRMAAERDYNLLKRAGFYATISERYI